MHYVIVGGCAAGIAAVEGIREIEPEGEITLISKERYPPYARCLITNYLIGTHSESSLYLREDIFYEKNKIDLILGEEVKKVIPSERSIVISGDKKIGYDRLLIATGASPKRLGVKGEEKKGVFNFRSIDDVKEILKKAGKCEKAMVFGGGLMGLKAGYALKQRGIEVEIIVKSPYILSQVVNKEASIFVSRWLEENGIKIKTGIAPVEILGDKEVEEVVLDNGEKQQAQIVIRAKGVSPNIALIKESGIKADEGIIVDEYLKTENPDIFSAGDVAEVKDLITEEYTIHALWSVAYEQGRTAGINMAGGKKIYPGSIGANATEFFGLPFISIGKVRETQNVEIIEVSSEKDYIYKRFVIRDNILIGTVLIGDISAAGIYMALIRSKTDIRDCKNILGKEWFTYGRVRKLIEEEKGFRESISPEGVQVYFK